MRLALSYAIRFWIIRHSRSRLIILTKEGSYKRKRLLSLTISYNLLNRTRHGTSHISTADSSGMAVSLTSTVGLLFGSHLMASDTGIVMNSEMSDFSFPNAATQPPYQPSSANAIKPGKRPLSSISPVMVEFKANRSLYFVIGGAGGTRIITSTVLGLWNVLDRNMSAPEALRAPRFHDQLIPNEVSLQVVL